MNTSVIDHLKAEDNGAFGLLYQKHFGMVSWFVSMNSGTVTDAEILFQDTMVVLMEKLQQDNYHLTASIKTYIMGIAKILWYKKFRTFQRETSYSPSFDKKNCEEINLFIEKEMTFIEKIQHYFRSILDFRHHIFLRSKTVVSIS